MCLKIDIINCGEQGPEECGSVVLDRHGGTIGRSAENQVVLADASKLISRFHAQVTCENGGYHLMDTSKNGTLIANRDLHLLGDKVELLDGDRIRIGDYELVVSINEPPEREPPLLISVPSEDVESDLRGMDCIDDFFRESGIIEPSGEDLLPQPDERPSPEIEDDDTGSASRQLDKGLDKRTRRNAQEIGSRLFDRFLQGAGIEEKDFFKPEDIPDLMITIGAVFREMVSGLSTVLQGRAEQKSEMRALMTGVLHIDNNPLKLSPMLEDALKSLIKRQHPAFLAPLEAVRKGFEDLMNHHMAIIAGIQPSLMEALERFDPERFSEKYKQGFAFQRKALCWDDYTRTYAAIRNEVLEELFGKVFVKAYEEQIKKLRSQGGKP